MLPRRQRKRKRKRKRKPEPEPEPKRETSLIDLPRDPLGLVFGLLSIRDVVACSETCRTLRAVADAALANLSRASVPVGPSSRETPVRDEASPVVRSESVEAFRAVGTRLVAIGSRRVPFAADAGGPLEFRRLIPDATVKAVDAIAFGDGVAIMTESGEVVVCDGEGRRTAEFRSIDPGAPFAMIEVGTALAIAFQTRMGDVERAWRVGTWTREGESISVFTVGRRSSKGPAPRKSGSDAPWKTGRIPILDVGGDLCVVKKSSGLEFYSVRGAPLRKVHFLYPSRKVLVAPFLGDVAMWTKGDMNKVACTLPRESTLAVVRSTDGTAKASVGTPVDRSMHQLASRGGLLFGSVGETVCVWNSGLDLVVRLRVDAPEADGWRRGLDVCPWEGGLVVLAVDGLDSRRNRAFHWAKRA